MSAAFILVLCFAFGNAYYLADESLDEERQIGNCFGEKQYGCRSLNGSICIAYEDHCDHLSHCRHNIDENAKCVYEGRKYVKTLVHAFDWLHGMYPGNNQEMLRKIFGKAYRPFDEIRWIFSMWNYPVKYPYLEQFYNKYIPQFLHRTLLHARSDDPKLFVAFLASQPGMFTGWSKASDLEKFIENPMRLVFKDLVLGGYFNEMK